LKWYFQFTPHDTHDWDSTHTPVLFDASVRGTPRKLLMVANRNGFYYVLDRQTGQFVTGKAYAKQSWAKGLDDRGRPILVPDMDPKPEGVPVYPGVHGGTNWFSPSYSPASGLFYIGVREEGTIYYRATADYKSGTYYTAGGIHGLPGVEPAGSVKAMDPVTGETKWEFPLHSPPWAGLLATAGGVIFGGTNEGNVFALDASSGKPLWDFQAGGPAQGNAVSYELAGKQYVVLTAGRALMAFTLE